MSAILTQDLSEESLEAAAFQELAISEVEKLLKFHPAASQQFLEKFLKKQLSWDSFLPVERSILLHFLLENTAGRLEESTAISALLKEDFIRTPPSPEEFLNTPTYLGPIYNKIYPPWRENLTFCLNPRNEIHEMIFPGAIRTGKTWSAIIAQMYKLTILSCLRNPPSYFGLADNTSLYFGLFTLSLEKAEGALADTFRRMMSESPYFKNVSPLKKKIGLRRVLNTMGDKQEQYEVLLPQNIKLILGSKLQHALSIAVISGIFDEVSFRTRKTVKEEDDENSAEAVYKQLRARITGQFNRLGHVPGILCVISSKKTTTDFLEAHIESVKNDPHTHICGGKNGYSQWDVRPEAFSKERFYVFVGSSKTASRIISDEEKKLYPEDSPNIIAVPSDLKRDFEYDINSALREHAGIATTGQALLFDDPLIVTQNWDQERKPVFHDEIHLGFKDSYSLKNFLNGAELFKDAGFATIPRYHPDMLRVIHLDLSKSGDATGFAMGGVSELIEYVGKNQFGQDVIRSLVPKFWIDFCVGIKAPQGDQVDYIKIQQFINYLKSNKFRIHLITFDQYQSVGPMQMLSRDGYNVDNRSIDAIDLPYIMLRDAMNSKNLSMYKNKILEKELINLVHMPFGLKMKVDHPKLFLDGHAGSKDQGDALAGVIAGCYELLTDLKKHPDTANADAASKIIEGLNTGSRPDVIPDVSGDENEMMENQIDKRNPYNFKL